MINSSLNISLEQFNNLFPFYIWIDDSLRIVSAGKSLQKILQIGENQLFSSLFLLKRPEVPSADFQTLKALQEQMVILEDTGGREILIRGQLVALFDDHSLVFIGSPWFGNMDQVRREKLTIHDFPLHDSIIDLLHVVKTQELVTSDLKDLLEINKRQKDELKKAAREMHDIALLPLQNPDPIIRIGPDGDIIFMNPTAVSLTSYEHRGVTVDAKTFWRQIVHEIDREEERWSFEAKSGSTFFSFVCRFFPDEGYFNIYGRDITQSKIKDENIRLLSLIAEENINAVVICDAQGKIVWVNKSYMETTGFSLDELIGRKPGPMLQGPDTDPDTIVYLKDRISKGEPFNCEIINYSKTGRRYWIKILGQSLRNAEGAITGYFAVEEDITKGKEDQERIRESESRLSVLIQSLKEGILLEDQYRKIALTNDNFCKMFSIPASAEDLIGADCTGSAEESKHLFRNPEEFVDRINRILAEKIMVQSEELELVNGQIYERDYIPIFINQVYQGHLWKYQDITGRKNYEKNLRLQEEKYHNIIANMNLGLIETDSQGLIQYANQRIVEMSGFSVDELTGQNSVDLFIIEEYRETARQNLLDGSGSSDLSEVQVRTKAGEVRWWLISGASMMNEEGRFIGSVWINLDITGSKRLEQELEVARRKAEESSQAKESFLANMSHEIRTPLHAIIGLVREFSRESLTPKQRSYVEKGKTASQHLLSLVNDILDISKIEAGQLHLEHRPFSLHEVIRETIAIELTSAIEKRLELQTDVSPEIAASYIGDPIRIRQILINLVSNAIKFTEKGNITVDCHVAERYESSHRIVFSVTDTGIGMDESFVGRIFDKFSQADSTVVRKQAGTGLGMRICYELVNMMNGDIVVSSKKGIGTTVTITLKLECLNQSDQTDTDSSKKYLKLEDTEVLLVEDYEINRLVTTGTLSAFGIRTTEAINGEEAINILRKKKFDVILMDLQMPVMDGLEATRIIRQEMRMTTPIIALTANAFKTEIERCMAAGMNDYVTKPFEEQTLLEAILRNLGDSSHPEFRQTEENRPVATEKLYDLDQVEKFNRGNRENMRRVIRLFIDQTPGSVDQIKRAWQENDLDTVAKVAHRIKPTMDLLSIREASQDIRTIETLAKEGSADPSLKEAIDRLDQKLRTVMEALAGDPIME